MLSEVVVAYYAATPKLENQAYWRCMCGSRYATTP